MGGATQGQGQGWVNSECAPRQSPLWSKVPVQLRAKQNHAKQKTGTFSKAVFHGHYALHPFPCDSDHVSLTMKPEHVPWVLTSMGFLPE